MAILRLSQFGGMTPLLDPHLLPDGAAVDATMTRPDGGGALKGLPQLHFLRNASTGTSTSYVFRVPVNDAGVNNIRDSSSVWFSSSWPTATFLRGPTVNDSFKRHYWLDNGGMYVATMEAIQNNFDPFYAVGVQSFDIPLELAPQQIKIIPGPGPDTGSIEEATGSIVTRAYTATYENIWGEEGAPVTPTECMVRSDAAVFVTLPSALPEGAQAPVSHVNLYRTVTGTSGATTFFKVAEVPLGADTYNDFKTDSQITSGRQLNTAENLPPPDGIEGMAMLPNGVMVGWMENSVLFSEPYKPWSWPAAYTYNVMHKIVGVGVLGQMVVVLTTGRPAIIAGVRPDAMSIQSHDVSMPCVSRRSIVSTPTGVIWATPTGLMMYGPQGFMSLSDPIGQDKWKTYQPDKIHATVVNGHYCAIWSPTNRGFMITPGDPSGIRLINYGSASSTTGASIGTDIYSGRSWLLLNGAINEWYAQDKAPDSYTWESKPFEFEAPINFSACQFFFAQDGTAGTSTTVTVFRWDIGDGGEPLKTQVAQFGIAPAQNGKTIRLPAGFLSSKWQFKFSGTAPLRSAVFATTVKELTVV